MKNKNSDTNATNYIRMPRILFGSVLIVITFALAIPTFAQTEYNLIEPLPGIQSVKDFPDFISRFIPFLLAFAALAAFVQIVFGGILRATSGGNSTAIGDANDRIWMAIGGLVLALSAYLILNTINPDLVSLRFLVPKVEIKAGGNLQKDAFCTENNQCQSGLKCIIVNPHSTEKKCENPIGVGGDCIDNTECKDGLECLVTPGSPVPKCQLSGSARGNKVKNEICVDDKECKTGLFCRVTELAGQTLKTCQQ